MVAFEVGEEMVTLGWVNTAGVGRPMLEEEGQNLWTWLWLRGNWLCFDTNSELVCLGGG
uniref:Uncharacterized protein n=1 Tax=Medicago truncatula TaxID=3880 RepID=A2Q262_MEDTR|nr:hypothetical protein MtrDRAFT_AC149210g22v2 [Medicago truncatula]